ncbi:MAG: ISKra4 family transposase [Acaryochloris sp. RU_4_1]|nr:ISKra4 family transposase [Acaryochloris sp. RU_4_1]
MNIKLSLVIESEEGTLHSEHEVTQLQRDTLSPATLGLTLSEAKQMLHTLQQVIVEHQIASYIDQQLPCPDCGQLRPQKGKHTLVYRTVFGKLQLQSPRLFHCPCQAHSSQSYSPLAHLLSERTSPEYLYLQTKFATLMSYGLSVDLLAEVLPLDSQINCSSVRSHLHHLGQRLDDELGEEQYMFVEGCPREWENLPRPDLPLTVGIDGGYINGYPKHKGESKSSFEVIVGKSITDSGDAKSFGFVQTYDSKPKRRLFELLKSQGMQMNQQVTFLSDGGDTVRELQLYLNPQAEHLLDWFHITMRITVLGQYLKGVKHHDAEQGEEMSDCLESIKWYLWHGNVFRALQKLETLEMDADCLQMDYLKLSKMAKAIREFRIYIENNQSFITNYGERYRCGERISTGFVESTVNQVIAKRMEKKQQMRWKPKGAHLLLQVRTKVLNGEWKNTIKRWYPQPELANGMPMVA